MTLKEYPFHNCENCGDGYMEYFRDDSFCTHYAFPSYDQDGRPLAKQGLCSSCNPFSYRFSKWHIKYLEDCEQRARAEGIEKHYVADLAKERQALIAVLESKDIDYARYKGVNFAAI